MTLRTFLRTNGAYIILVVVIFFTLLTLLSILGVTFTPIEDKHIQKVVTIESFADSDFSDGLCEKHSAEPHEIESKCRELTEDNCNSTSCCVWLNGQTCVGGNKNGPTYHSDGDKDIDVSYYHHKNTCKGDCPNVEGFTPSRSQNCPVCPVCPAPAAAAQESSSKNGQLTPASAPAPAPAPETPAPAPETPAPTPDTPTPAPETPAPAAPSCSCMACSTDGSAAKNCTSCVANKCPGQDASVICNTTTGKGCTPSLTPAAVPSDDSPSPAAAPAAPAAPADTDVNVPVRPGGAPKSFDDRSDADTGKAFFWQDAGINFLKDNLPIGRGPGNASNIYNTEYFNKNCGLYVTKENEYLYGSQPDTSELLGTIQPCPDNLVPTLESWAQTVKAGDPFTKEQYDVLGYLTSDENASGADAKAANIAACKDPTKACKYTDWMTMNGGLLGSLSFSHHCDDGRGPSSSAYAANSCPYSDWVDSDPNGMPAM